MEIEKMLGETGLERLFEDLESVLMPKDSESSDPLYALLDDFNKLSSNSFPGNAWENNTVSIMFYPAYNWIHKFDSVSGLQAGFQAWLDDNVNDYLTSAISSVNIAANCYTSINVNSGDRSTVASLVQQGISNGILDSSKNSAISANGYGQLYLSDAKVIELCGSQSEYENAEAALTEWITENISALLQK